jgi:hypothetical protein
MIKDKNKNKKKKINTISISMLLKKIKMVLPQLKHKLVILSMNKIIKI